LGYVIAGATYLADPSPFPGTTPPNPPSYGPAQGELLIIEFLVTNVSIAPTTYECEIGLYDTILVNSTDLPIEHGIYSNLTYNACYETAGWYLDCFTDVYRKTGNTTTEFIGIGLNETADCYEPQELVILYAYLEYNQEPEAYKPVDFEIHGPPNPYYNITIFRSTWTNASGIATINFTIPGSGFENWPDMVMGHWTCYQAAQVKLLGKIEDWLYWKVGWIIEVIEVEVIPGPGGWTSEIGPQKCEWIEIVVTYKTISFISKHVLFTVTAFDELLDPVQWDEWEVEVDPTDYYLCSERTDVTSVYSHIPPWAHVGLGTIYVNAFTDYPSACGCSYCPEVSVGFWIVATA
jgi:hypothetical protein